MKEMYISPAIEVVEYEVEDVITASAGTPGVAENIVSFNTYNW